MKWFLVMIMALMVSSAAIAQDVKFLHDKLMDFGDIKQGRNIKGAIEFVNNGANPLEVEEVKPSCGCTVATLDKKTFASGEKAHIPFTIETGNTSGNFRKTIRIYFKEHNSEERTSEVIVISAKIITDLAITPKYLSMRNVAVNPDTVISKFFEIENSSGSKIEIERIYSEDARLKVTPETATIPGGKSHLVRLDFVPDKPGRINPKVHVVARQRNLKPLTLKVFIHVNEALGTTAATGSD